MNQIHHHMSRFFDTYSPAIPSTSPLPASTPIPSISHLTYPSTSLSPTNPHNILTSNHYLTFSNFSPTFISQSADLISVFAFLTIAYRTYRYINLRRNGLVGPSAAPPLIKLWSLYGFIQFASQIISLYLSPLHAHWIVSALQALILALLLSLPQFAHLLYHHNLSPLYDSHAPRVEHYFSSARKHWDEINDAFRELATYLLKRIAVGGLSNAIVLPSAEEQSQPSSAQPSASSERPRQRGALLPKETAVFPTGRKFFAGEAEQRAETVINARSGTIGNAIQVAIPEAPRPLYEEARVMRAQFRKRSSKAKLQRTDPS